MHKNGKFERTLWIFFLCTISTKNWQSENWKLNFFSLPQFLHTYAFNIIQTCIKTIQYAGEKNRYKQSRSNKESFQFFSSLIPLQTNLMLHKCEGKRRIKLLFWIKDKVIFICSTFYAKKSVFFFNMAKSWVM